MSRIKARKELWAKLFKISMAVNIIIKRYFLIPLKLAAFPDITCGLRFYPNHVTKCLSFSGLFSVFSSPFLFSSLHPRLLTSYPPLLPLYWNLSSYQASEFIIICT